MCKKKKFLITFIFSFCIIFTFYAKVYATTNNNFTDLNITAKRSICVDLNSGDIIYAKNANEKCQPASTTKLLTALLLSEHIGPSSYLTYTENAFKQPSTSVFLDFNADISKNHKISSDDVLESLLLHSANDMACVIAENISSNMNSFSNLMDQKAKSLGMLSSDFYTPSGLDSDDFLNGNNHYTTAYDLAILAKECFKDDWIMNTLSKSEDIALDLTTVDNNVITLKNSNLNLNKNGCLGGKTGYTDKAGSCLVSFYSRDNRILIGVVLGSENRKASFDDMNKLMNYSFAAKKTTFYPKNSVVETKTLDFKPFLFFGPSDQLTVNLLAADDISLYKNEANTLENAKLETNSSLISNNKENLIASLTFKYENTSQTFFLKSDISLLDVILKYLLLYLLFFILIILSIILIIRLIKNLNVKNNI